MDPENPVSQETITESIEFLQGRVKELIQFRDQYFENHSLDEADLKNERVEKFLQNVLDDFTKYKDCAPNDRAMYNYLKGKAINTSPNYSKEAEDLLSKSVKLNPKLVEAWNELGDVYWKNSNYTEAKNCLLSALKYRRDKTALRMLSMVLRAESASSPEEARKKVEESLKHAKESVQIDPHDGESWAVLGTAHLYSYFTTSQDPQILKRCLSAYSQAEKDPLIKYYQDLPYNRAWALYYAEEYKESLESYELASDLDPLWLLPKVKIKNVTQYLDNINEFVNNKGKMKGRQLQRLIQSIDIKKLGPYSGGRYTNQNGFSAKLELVPIESLNTGMNEEKLIFGKVVCSVQNENEIPFTFCMIDKNETCIAVTVYNLVPGKGVIIGDSVAIPDPYLTVVNFTYRTKQYNFKSIRVPTPILLVVNGKKLSPNVHVTNRVTNEPAVG